MIVKGAPETAVAALADAPYAVVLTVLNDGPKTIADLKGKKISVSNRGGLTYWLAQELSRRQGWGPEGFAITPLGATTAQTAALKTKQIDGMIVEVNAGYRLEEEKSGRVLVQFGDLLKTFHIYVLYAHTEFAVKNPAAVRAFLAGWFETIDWMQKNRERTIDIVRRKTDVSLALATRDYDELSGMFNKTGRFNPEALKVLSRSFVEMGILPNEPDVTKLVTEQYLPGNK
jgi:ABC-type nitrate/sulfonate/bicarbonate transport system substrate-binding protein